jgi:hypothetical protein
LIARLLVLTALTTQAVATSTFPQELPPEYKVKAQIVLRFADRFSWPEKAFPEAKSPFKIGILGKDPFGDHLEDAIKGQKSLKDRGIELKKDSDPAKLLDCHLVFLAGSEDATLDEALKAFKGKPMLTMGDTPGFAKRGSTINLLLEKGAKGYKTQFELNKETMESAGLKADAPLLKAGQTPKAKDEGP